MTLRKNQKLKKTLNTDFMYKRPNWSFFLHIFIIILIVILVIVAWEVVIEHFNIPKRIVPKPSDLYHFFQREFLMPHSSRYQTVLTKSLYSFRDALFGFSIALVLGSIIGIFLSLKRGIYAILFPFLFLTQLVPVPALAPVVAAILGYGYSTKIFIIVLFIIFPIAIAVRNTVLNIPENYSQLLHTYTTKKYITFKYLILPSLVPTLLSVMKIVCTASIVATIIAELPLSVKEGIGKDIYNSFNNQMIPRVWVSVILISIVSLLFFQVLSYLEKYITSKYKYGEF